MFTKWTCRWRNREIKKHPSDLLTCVPFNSLSTHLTPEHPKEPLSQLLTASISLCMYISDCNSGDPGLIPGSGSSPGEGIGFPLQYSWASLVAQIVKNLPAMWETWVWSLGWEDTLEENMQATPVFLSGESPWIEEPGKIQTTGLQRAGHD